MSECMTSYRKGMSRRFAGVVVALSLFFTSGPIGSALALTNPSGEKPIAVIKAYLKATHAHDFRSAYRHISSIDRRIRDENVYLRSEATFSGFALELAKKLADNMEVWVLEEKLGTAKASYHIGYRVPAADEITPQLLDWNPDKLNALSASEQGRLLKVVEGLKNRRQLIALEGQETFDLVLEKSSWRIFLDWPSRARILFEARQPRSRELEVKFLRNDFLVKIDDPFQIDFTIKNRTDHNLNITLNHLFEPKRSGENADMIACGSLAPLRLAPRSTQSLSTNYIFRGPMPKSSRLSIIYDFTTWPAVVERKKVP